MIAKDIYRIIPSQFSNAVKWNILLTILNLLLDFVSIILLIPIFITLLNVATLQSSTFLFKVLEFSKNHSFETIGFIIAFYVIKNATAVYIIRYQSKFYYSLSNALSVSLLQNFFNNSLLNIKKQKKSEISKDIIFIPNNFSIYVLSSFILIISDTILLILILVCALLIHPLATIYLFIITSLIIAILYFSDRIKIKRINNNIAEQYNQNFSHIYNAISGYIEIKTTQTELFFIEKFNRSNDSLNKVYAELNTARLVKPKHTETFLVVIVSSLLLISKITQAENHLNMIFISFIFASTIKIIPSINRILNNLTNLKSNTYTIDLLKTTPKTTTLGVNDTQKIKIIDKIELKNISFKYEHSKQLLDNISLTIQKGAIIGIIGDSGNGKSTLVSIITQMIQQDEGMLLCDNYLIDEVNKNAFLKNIAYVPQSPFILEGTILENLVLNNTPISTSILDEYLTLFDLDDTIKRLPQGLNTFIGSNGYTLSGGQIQRLAIVRALLLNKDFLILDEAMNQLDVTIKYKIIKTINDIAQKKKLTMLVISHNSDELKQFCNSIYELKEGHLKLIQ